MPAPIDDLGPPPIRFTYGSYAVLCGLGLRRMVETFMCFCPVSQDHSSKKKIACPDAGMLRIIEYSGLACH